MEAGRLGTRSRAIALEPLRGFLDASPGLAGLSPRTPRTVRRDRAERRFALEDHVDRTAVEEREAPVEGVAGQTRACRSSEIRKRSRVGAEVARGIVDGKGDCRRGAVRSGDGRAERGRARWTVEGGVH